MACINKKIRQNYMINGHFCIQYYRLVFVLLFSPYVEKLVRQNGSKKLNDFNSYFDSVATIIHSSVELNKNCTPIEWPGLVKLPIVDITVVMTSSGTRNMLGGTLVSFFTQNSYPLSKMIVIYDGKPTEYTYQMISTYRNITWIISNIRLGQLAAVDQVYRHIDTQYYFHTEDDWDFLRPGFIQYCLQVLEFDPKVSGLHLTRVTLPYQQNKPYSVGPLQINTEHQLPSYSGFSFWPSVHRLKDYKRFKNGYNMATFNLSYGVGVGYGEPFLSIQYSMMGYYYAIGPLQFVLHTGAGIQNASPKKLWSVKDNKEWDQVLGRYSFWQGHQLKSLQKTQQNIKKSLQKSIQRTNSYKNQESNTSLRKN